MERLLADLVRGVNHELFDPHVLVLNYLGRFGEGLDEAGTIHRATPMSRFSMIRPLGLTRRIAAIAPAVVHTHSGIWLKGARAARAAGVPRVIHTEHGRKLPDPWQARLVDNLASRFTNVAVGVSEAASTLLRAIVQPSCAVTTIRNGVDTELFCPGRASDLRRELGIRAGQQIIGSIGRLEPIKGYDTMIEAFALLLSQHHREDPPVLVLAGDGSQRTFLSRRVEELGIADQVRLLGWRDDVVSLLAGFDVFAMSSRSEGTSVSLLEAMSCGLCPVVTRVGGNPEVLGPALQHLLLPPDDPRGYADALQGVLSDHHQRMRDAVIARKRVQEHYSAAAMVAQYEQLYAEAASARVDTAALGVLA